MFFNFLVNKKIKQVYKYESLAALSFSFFSTFVIIFAPIIMRREGVNDFWMGVITSAPIAGSLFIFFWLNFSFKVDKFKFVTITKAVSRLVLIIPVIIGEPILFIIFFFLMNIMEKGTSPIYTSLMRDIYPKQYRGRAMGLVRIELTLLSVLLFVIAGRLFDLINYRIIFSFGILFGIMSQILFYRIKKNVKIKKRKLKKFKMRDIFLILNKDRLMLKYQLIFFMLGFSNILGTTLVPLYFIDVLKMSNLTTGSFFSINSIALIIGYYYFGRHIDKYNPLKTRIIVMFLLSVFHLLFFLSFFFINLKFFIFTIIGIAYFFYGIASSGGELARINLFTRIIKRDMIEKYWAIDFFLLGIRGAISPFVAIWLKSIIGFKILFITSFILINLSAILMYRLYKKNYNHLKSRGLY